jgi:broad specificity phosphatase PhoE
MIIYVSRHGESVNNVKGVIGGDCHITESGQEYGKFLASYFKNVQIMIWTSELKRTQETAAYLKNNKQNNIKKWKDLNEIYSGYFDNWSLEKIKQKYPDIYAHRNSDKINNKYPNGESYKDLEKRVTSVINKIDDKNNGILLIIAHKAVCRVIKSLLTQMSLKTVKNKNIDLHTLYYIKGDRFEKICHMSKLKKNNI